jgi:hypothetical protein
MITKKYGMKCCNKLIKYEHTFDLFWLYIICGSNYGIDKQKYNKTAHTHTHTHKYARTHAQYNERTRMHTRTRTHNTGYIQHQND